ncbi:uncharacterized protein FTOL_13853 [Fusarium torulosum]|uniref:Uncharacterized protein n=1 Tax=Fusarium torulosum TaxID=33205 RepID=A0AAE8MMI0_9HYPO|nr:uncharacterized protein FTOL_13853 [Fusarium torulosum]
MAALEALRREKPNGD